MTRQTSFWDRRRAAVKAEETAVQDPLPDECGEHDARSDADILSALNLPDPSTLKMGDDFTGFLARAVPVHLRNRALRQLWRSNPVLACVDGLNDYDADYLTGSTGNGPIKTAYQVGKGMLAHIEDQARRAATPEATGPSEAESPFYEDTQSSAAPRDDFAAAPDSPERAGPYEDAASAQGSFHETETAATAPRRMRFTFQGDAA